MYLLLGLLLCLILVNPSSAQADMSLYESALQHIRRAEATQATELNLSVWGLTELPPEIGQPAMASVGCKPVDQSTAGNRRPHEPAEA